MRRENDQRLPTVVRLPYYVPSVHYRPYLEHVGAHTCLEWALRRICRRAKEVWLLVHQDERRNPIFDKLNLGGVHICFSPHVFLLPALTEVSCTIGSTRIALAGLGFALAPCDLLDRVYVHHLHERNDYTLVRGLPKGCGVEVYEVSALSTLNGLSVPNLPEQVSVAFDLLRAVSQTPGCQPICVRGEPFDTAKVYDLESRVLPERVGIDGPDDVRIIRQLIQSGDRNSTDDSLGMLARWKMLCLQRHANRIRRHTRFWSGTSSLRRNGRDRVSPKRVLYVSPASAYSGAEEALCDLIAALDRTRWMPYASVALTGAFTSRLRTIGVPVSCPNRSLSAGGMDSFLYYHRLLSHLSPDIIHANTTLPLTCLIAATLRCIPVIQHVRVAAIEGYGEALHYSAACIAVSRFVAQRVEASNVPPQRIHVIYDGIDLTRYRPGLFDRRQSRGHFGIPLDAIVALFIARFVPLKRHDLFLHALKIARETIPSLHGVIVGERPVLSDYYDDIQRQVEECGLRNHVTFLDFQQDIRQVESSADVVVSACDAEAFGRSIIEAMAQMIPVIVNDSGGLREVVGNGVTGRVVPSGSPRALAVALRDCICDRASTAEWSARALQYVREHLDIPQASSQCMSLYDAVARSSP